jgi:hypothetical protein
MSGNPKSQAPNPKQFLNTQISKHRMMKSRRTTRQLWDLSIGASLGFGIWDLELSAVIAFFN